MHALNVTRQENFPEWYQAVCREADMAEPSPTRGSMIIKPWGMGIWERLRDNLDARIKETGHDNYYFPLLIPMSFIAKEADHVEGFAKEMAVVTHHRLKNISGALGVDPDAELEEPYIIRPTSETIIGDAMSRWVKSYRDLPLLTNQWANVMRWEMRTRLFLRTAEFLWQEGHTAHVDKADALQETMRMLEVYRVFAEDFMAMPVIAGEKPANERFPGADNTFSIEAMMQDGKALQAGTSHYLGTHFSEAQNIRYQDRDGGQTLAHTTSWGVSTRLIGGLIMTHGDDDGLRAPPAVAPRQVVIVPMLRGKPEDADLLAYCDKLAEAVKAQRAFGETVRVLIDRKDYKPSDKRWDWVRKGAPVICEIGPRDAANGQVSYLRRDKLRGEGKIAIASASLEQFAGEIGPLLESIQASMKAEADHRLKSNIKDDIKSFDELAEFFAGDEDMTFRGWVRASWAKPEGAALEAIADRLKALKLTLRNAPMEQPATHKPCLFSGAQGVQQILIARAY